MALLLSIQAITGFLALIIFYNVYFSKAKTNKSKNKEAPEPAGGWPVIGHLHLLGGSKPLFRTLGAMADIYGPAFTLRLGMRRALIVSSPELAKECFTTNDKALATRPESAAGKCMGYNHAMFGLAPHGPYWREMRKIATVELLSHRRLELLKEVRVTEIDTIIKELFGLWVMNNQNPVKVDMKRWFSDLMFNVVVMMITGKRYFGYSDECEEGEARQVQEAVHKLMHLSGLFVVSDALPFLEWMDFGGHLSAMKKTATEFDFVLVSWLEEHRRRRISGQVDGDQDFIDVMLSIMDGAVISGYDLDTVIKATSMTLIIAGSDTTSISLTWALSLLLNNPQVIKNAQNELDIHVGKEKQVDESDVKKLVYLQAIVKETLRLYPVAPLGVPHEAVEDCHIGGFHVPAGTQVFLNIWKLHRDPGVWSDPFDFRPERFLTGGHVDVDFKGPDFEYLPFGSGRRSCPGMSLALQVLHLMLARLLQSFDMATPSDAPVDLTESIAITLPKATPLEVLFIPRLPFELY